MLRDQGQTQVHLGAAVNLIMLLLLSLCWSLQVLVKKQVPTLQALMANAQHADTAVLSELAVPDSNVEVNRWDLIQRGEV